MGGPTSVNVFVSRATTVACEDGSEGFATLTLRTPTDEATAPGPVSLNIDRRLLAAEGVAVVDLIEEYSPGCGQEPCSTVLPGQTVRIVVEGTTVRFRTGIESRASQGRYSARLRSVDFARDGVGSASIGSSVQDADSEAAFLKYAVDRSGVRGDTIGLPPNAAPAGGFGAVGAYTRERVVDGAAVFEDVFVTATVGAAPQREERIDVFALRSTQVACGGGESAEMVEVVEGSGPVPVAIDPRLAQATAAGTITATRFSFDGCTGVAEDTTAPVDVALSVTAAGAVVRSVDDRFQVRPGEGVIRDRLTYQARPALGTAAVGDISGPLDLAAISRAGR